MDATICTPVKSNWTRSSVETILSSQWIEVPQMFFPQATWLKQMASLLAQYRYLQVIFTFYKAFLLPETEVINLRITSWASCCAHCYLEPRHCSSIWPGLYSISLCVQLQISWELSVHYLHKVGLLEMQLLFASCSVLPRLYRWKMIDGQGQRIGQKCNTGVRIIFVVRRLKIDSGDTDFLGFGNLLRLLNLKIWIVRGERTTGVSIWLLPSRHCT